jgi:1-deoxy-D-xylulose-5-phosphate synthase
MSFELKKGTKIAVLSSGPIGNMISEIIAEIDEGTSIGHYDFPFKKPMDQRGVRRIFKSYEHIITIEDSCITGGFGSAVLEFANSEGINTNCKIFGIPDAFIPHGSVEDLHKIAGLDKSTVKSYIEKVL